MEFSMICTCGVDGFLAAEERRLRIFNRMGLDVRENLTTAIVLSLAFDFLADVSMVGDMWFGVSLTTPLLDEPLRVECDQPADGLALLWEHLADCFPERVTVKSDRWALAGEVAASLSSMLIDNYKTAKARLKFEKDSQFLGVSHEVAFCLVIIAEKSITDMWGMGALDATVDRVLG